MLAPSLCSVTTTSSGRNWLTKLTDWVETITCARFERASGESRADQRIGSCFRRIVPNRRSFATASGCSLGVQVIPKCHRVIVLLVLGGEKEGDGASAGTLD